MQVGNPAFASFIDSNVDITHVNNKRVIFAFKSSRE